MITPRGVPGDRGPMPALLLAVFTFVLAAWAPAQKNPSAESSILKKIQAPPAIDAGIPLSATVDPEKYFLGPSDLLSVNLWTSPAIQHHLEVTLEGTVIIPTVGEVYVSETLLSEAKKKILDAVRNHYHGIDASVTLLKPRRIVVSVRGHVLHEGQYSLYATDRADMAIHEANTALSPEENDASGNFIREMSERRIIVRHRDGTQTRVDLVKFRATKEDDLDPYLREGDVLVVPRMDEARGVFGVYGEVNMPGRYEAVGGDRLTDALRIAQGMTAMSRPDSAEFSRLSTDGRSMSVRYLDFSTLEPGSESDVLIQPGDRLVVRSLEDVRADFRVRVEGEVLYPGTYPITKDRSKISEVIRQAGGFTEFAALGSAELNRSSVQPREVELDRLMSLRGGVSDEDSLDYVRETDLRLRKEIVNVDFPRLFLQGDSTQDVILQDEDVIRVPSVKRTVYVFGQIVSPGHIPFVEGEPVNFYVDKAGGFTDRARQDDIRIIKSKTKQWLAVDETGIEEGDYIWVPKEPDRPFSYYMTSASQAAGILSVIIGMAAVIISVSK